MPIWVDFQDIIGDANTWPAIVRYKFWCSDLGYRDRAFIAAFAYCNGAPPQMLIDTLAVINRRSTPVKLRKILDLFVYWDHPVEGFNRRERYFSYDLILRRLVTLNGTPYQLRDRRQRRYVNYDYMIANC